MRYVSDGRTLLVQHHGLPEDGSAATQLLALQVPEMLEGIADDAAGYTLNAFLRWQYPDD